MHNVYIRFGISDEEPRYESPAAPVPCTARSDCVEFGVFCHTELKLPYQIDSDVALLPYLIWSVRFGTWVERRLSRALISYSMFPVMVKLRQFSYLMMIKRGNENEERPNGTGKWKMGTKLNLDPSAISKFITHSFSSSYLHFPVARAHYPFLVPCFSNIGF